MLSALQGEGIAAKVQVNANRADVRLYKCRQLLEMRTITQFGMEGRDKQRRPSLLDCNKSHRAGQFGISLDNSNNELCRAASADPAPSRSLLQL
ncbi:hypothetical protein J6590_103075 [Homalodisca vitripennis]|nr:hypothetical protein J6590_103075 [Homalodisca vitripennis]